MVYGADGAPSHEVCELAQDADLLVLEATFADDVAAGAASGHMTGGQAGELAARAGARRLLLTHLLAVSDRDATLAAATAAFGAPA